MTPVNGPCSISDFDQVHGVVVGVAGVDDQRQAGAARGGDVGAEAARLPIARRQVVEIVEAALADRDHPRVRGELDQRRGIVQAFLAGLVRVDADGAVNLGATLGQSRCRPASLSASRAMWTMVPTPAAFARSITPASSSARPG